MFRSSYLSATILALRIEDLKHEYHRTALAAHSGRPRPYIAVDAHRPGDSSVFSPQRQERLKEKILLSAALKFGKSKEELAATRQSRPCPLLEEDKCVVYPWRPLTCRAMHSLDREHCRASHTAGDLRSDEYYLHRYTFPLSLAAGFTEGFRALDCQSATLDLSQALREVLLEPHLGERWLKGEMVFNNLFPGEHLSQEI